MTGFSWPLFFVLFGLGVFGGLAILPYSFALNKNNLAQAKLPQPVLMLIGFVQTAVLMAIAVGVGLLAAKPVGLDAPYIRAALAGTPAAVPFVRLLPISIGLGVLSFAAIMLLEQLVFKPHIPEALSKGDVKVSAWKRFLASFYGGIDEEILLRLFIVSGLVWILGRFWVNASGMPTNGAFWTAIVLATILFGLGHLPTTKALAPLTPMVVTRAIVLNGIAGIAFGWLYWQYGLEAAMVAHFSADILLHLISPFFQKS